MISGCRSCGSEYLRSVLSLGNIPLTDSYVEESDLSDPEPRFPLDVAFCPECSLVQIIQTVPPEAMFSDYAYFSSFADTVVANAQQNTDSLIAKRNLGPNDLVVEIASNDGYLLKNFVGKGIPVLGIDPAEGPAGVARSEGVPTITRFFDRHLALELRKDGGADVIIANNVLAHVPDLNGFVAGIATLLKDEGVAVIEAPYIRDLIEKGEFDTIYHEHLCYFSVTALTMLFRRHGLWLNEVEHLPIHGGSLRLYVEKVQRPMNAGVFLDDERRCGLIEFDYYRKFETRVQNIQTSLVHLLGGLKAEGCSIAAYGAAAKGTVILNSAGVDSETIDFVVDRNVHKQGKYLPGTRIPIRDTSVLSAEVPDYVLLLSWNFRDEVIAQQRDYLAAGGRFIVPVPYPEVISLDAHQPAHPGTSDDRPLRFSEGSLRSRGPSLAVGRRPRGGR
ncbi:MAG: class I SAM-dependent methyltransferase [Actinomycetota bacterium]